MRADLDALGLDEISAGTLIGVDEMTSGDGAELILSFATEPDHALALRQQVREHVGSAVYRTVTRAHALPFFASEGNLRAAGIHPLRLGHASQPENWRTYVVTEEREALAAFHASITSRTQLYRLATGPGHAPFAPVAIDLLRRTGAIMVVQQREHSPGHGTEYAVYYLGPPGLDEQIAAAATAHGLSANAVPSIPIVISDYLPRLLSGSGVKLAVQLTARHFDPNWSNTPIPSLTSKGGWNLRTLVMMADSGQTREAQVAYGLMPRLRVSGIIRLGLLQLWHRRVIENGLPRKAPPRPPGHTQRHHGGRYSFRPLSHDGVDDPGTGKNRGVRVRVPVRSRDGKPRGGKR